VIAPENGTGQVALATDEGLSYHRILGCPECGTRQSLPDAPPRTTIRCITCAGTLERTHGRSLTGALACSSATLLLLVPANLCMFLRTDALGVSRSSHLASAATAMARDGWPLLAIVVFLFVVLFPILRFALLTAVLGALELGRHPRWLGPAFRWANRLATWAMLDVFLIGLAVAYARLADSVAVQVGAGAYCFIAAAILSLIVRATLDKAAVWSMIAPDRAPQPLEDAIECTDCDLLVGGHREGAPCPRCGARTLRRRRESLSRTIALTLAGLLLYIPANLYPLATLPIHYQPTTYTVLEGVIELAQNGLWDLAILVFTASFAIPFLKLAGIGWCIHSVLRRSDRHLVAKTHTYRMVEEIGRWSMVDPFVIGAFVPVMNYNSLIYGRAEPAAVPFTCVVILTIIAAKTFDPRLMWDAGQPKLRSAH
jgi:paraquat-inducible protein A